jgi:2-polyprenyl-3-methyl-5-hydroxy-6-metoxy-1,4-benzoquinol methylase
MTTTQVMPARIIQIATGTWGAAVLASAASHSLFAHLETGAKTASDIATRAGISERGTQALLDGLVALDLVELHDGSYRNTAEASSYLISRRPGYLGGFAEVLLSEAASWSALPDAVRTGEPAMTAAHDAADATFYEKLVPALAPLATPVAHIAAQKLDIANRGEIAILDVGGGAGVYSSTWLALNPAAHSTQVDWAPVNAVARRLVTEHGVGDRFDCIDGDLHTVDFGNGRYDYIVYSHVAHVEGPQDNADVIARFRRALKPGGTLVISELIADDDRSGPPFALLFASTMLLQTTGGTTWRPADYRQWLTAAGFADVTFESTPTPSTLIFAR